MKKIKLLGHLMSKMSNANNDRFQDRVILGLHEYVEFLTDKGVKKYLAKVDTGAMRSSIDYDVAEDLDLGPPVKNVKVFSALGAQKRPVVEAKIRIKGVEIETTFSVSERKHLTRKVLIGINTLKQLHALVDPLIDIKE